MSEEVKGVGAFGGRVVMITGAGGSIGSQLCMTAIAQGAKRLVLVSATENALYQIERSIRRQFPNNATELFPVLASVTDFREMRFQMITREVELVVHAAAHKHVPLCELNPMAAARNNVWGTNAMMVAAADARVSQFCLISTDKAVNPASIMGGTKRLAELLVKNAHSFLKTECSYFTVRFGNVLDSAGSVLPLWREQLAMGLPVTVTDPRCERYFMSIPEAVGLVEGVIGLRPPSGLFVLDMGEPKNLLSMAQRLVEQNGKPTSIKFTGLRPGEKLTEELHYGGEVLQSGLPRVLVVVEPEGRPFNYREFEALFQLLTKRDVKRAVATMQELCR